MPAIAAACLSGKVAWQPHDLPEVQVALQHDWMHRSAFEQFNDAINPLLAIGPVLYILSSLLHMPVCSAIKDKNLA